METKEEFTEIIKSIKDLDAVVQSMHNLYGDILQVDIKQYQEDIDTQRYSERPEPIDDEEDITVEYLPE